MAVNKVDVNGVTVLDLTQDSVTPATLKRGETAHDASGTAIVGEMESSTPSLQSKSVTYTSNGTATITPDAGYDGLSSVDVTVNVASGGGGAEPARLTITSQSYTGNRYGTFMFVNSEGHLDRLNYTNSPFTFPINVETVLGGTVAFVSEGLPGLPFFRNLIGCEADKYHNVFYFLVTSSQASVEMYDNY